MKTDFKNILPLLLFMASPLVFAETCDGLNVSFIVDGTDKWHGLSALEVYKQENVPNEKQGITLKNLITPYAKQGTLILYACGGKNKSFEVADMLSNTHENSDLFLTLSKKNFFKLVNANNSKPILKKVYQIKLTP